MLYNICMNKITKTIEKLHSLILENRKLLRKKQAGLPVAAVLYFNEETIIWGAVNKKTTNKVTDYRSHCEMGCITNNSSSEKSLNLIVTIPPCKECFDEIKKFGKIKYIYWLFDKYGNNSVKDDPSINIKQYIPKNHDESLIIKEIKKIYFYSQNNYNRQRNKSSLQRSF